MEAKTRRKFVVFIDSTHADGERQFRLASVAFYATAPCLLRASIDGARFGTDIVVVFDKAGTSTQVRVWCV